jgi:stage II sporulation protein AA (anti-sigma F factor antagonist)
MEIQVETLKRCHLVKLSGQIDSATASEFQASLLDLIQEGARNLVLSFGDVTFISSAGLSALLRARIRAKKKLPPGDVVLAELSPHLREVFELVGLHYVFKFYETDAEAVGSF